jgi:hypothetical protein
VPHRQVSFLDHPELIGTARYGITVSMADMALRLGCVTERSFDDLGLYEFFAVETDSGLFGFRMHVHRLDRGSLVSFRAKGDVDAIRAISDLCGIDASAVLSFEEPW